MFSWIPGKRLARTWAHGPTAGFGFDLESPILFGGYGGTYNYNVTFLGGVVIHRKTTLDGRYTVGEVLTESLDSDALTRRTYDFNAFIGIAFRLGSNPFKAIETAESSGGK